MQAIKAATGYNSRQCSVRMNSSLQYVTVTVRDAAVNVEAVKAACAELNTWTMDTTDYVEGQSVRVETTDEVKAAHAAPFLATVEALEMPTEQTGGVEIVPGVYLILDSHNVYVSDCNGNRSQFLYARDFESRNKYTMQAAALYVAQILAKQPAEKAA